MLLFTRYCCFDGGWDGFDVLLIGVQTVLVVAATLSVSDRT